MHTILRTRHALVVAACLVIIVALGMGAAVGAARGKKEIIPLDETSMIFEVNSTDGDAGIQIFLDGEGWKKVKVFGPDNKKLFEVKGKGNLKNLGLTELFFESEEPSFDEMTLEEILALFPAGDYGFSGTTTDGNKLTGTATLTHDIPDGPVILAPEEDVPVDPDNAVVTWEPVTTPAGIEIVGYQVIVELEEPLRVFSVLLPAEATSVTVPPEFLDPEMEYKVEILAIEVSGNQTITEREFETE